MDGDRLGGVDEGEASGGIRGGGGIGGVDCWTVAVREAEE